MRSAIDTSSLLSQPTPLLLSALMGLTVALITPQRVTAEPTGSPKTLEEGRKVSRVTLLADRAEVTRELTLSCQRKGEGLVARFPSLPQLVQPKTLRAELSGPAELIGVSHSPQSSEGDEPEPTRPQSEALNALYQTQREAQRELKKLQASEQLLQERAHMISQEEAVQREAVNAALTTGTLNLKALKRALDERERSTAQLHKALAELRIKRERLERALREAVAEEARLNARRLEGPSGGEGLASLSCTGAGRVVVALSYVTAGARWRPEYDVKVQHSGSDAHKRAPLGRASLTWLVNASVEQSTGEVWEEVALTLSTAQPNLGDRAPLPASLSLYAQEDKRKKVLTQRAQERRHLSASGGASAPPPSNVLLEDRGQSFGLVVPQRVTIKPHGQPYWVPVSRSKTTAKVSLVATPKLSPYVFRVARFKVPTAHPLPEGALNVSVNGVVIGQQRSPYRSAGEPIELSLGLDERLLVTREPLKRTDEEGGLLDDEQTLSRSYQLTLKSFADEALKVELLENVPISESRDIKVALDPKTSKGYTLDGETGFLSWQVKLPAMAEEQRRFGYIVKLPDDWKVR